MCLWAVLRQNESQSRPPRLARGVPCEGGGTWHQRREMHHQFTCATSRVLCCWLYMCDCQSNLPDLPGVCHVEYPAPKEANASSIPVRCFLADSTSVIGHPTFLCIPKGDDRDDYMNYFYLTEVVSSDRRDYAFDTTVACSSYRAAM